TRESCRGYKLLKDGVSAFLSLTFCNLTYLLFVIYFSVKLFNRCAPCDIHQHNSSMASNESIGSCSLDVDVTASDTSECLDAGTISARTLRSLPLSAKSQDPDTIPTELSGGASTPEYVKRTALVPVVNGNSIAKAGEYSLGDDNFKGKKPSYLGLACSISGYSGITTYDSKLREGFRSRDHSPGRISIIKSRDVSPLRSNGEQITPTYRESTRNFMSSMLTTDSSFSSTHYESSNSPLTSVPRDGFGAFSPVKCSPESPKTAARDSPGSRVTLTRDSSGLSTPIKPSPESPKTSSKDSLTAPTVSPQKRSPGAVRVVEFTSQTKSYDFSDSSQSKNFAEGSQSSRSVLTDGESHSFQTNGSNAENTWSSKSFIQQRVERLYGPGALAQGFFRRVRSKPPDEVQEPPEGEISQNGIRSNTNSSLPVLRHLRPEFRAQLSLGPTTKKISGHEEESSVVQISTDDNKRSKDIPPLQQQISVESLTESISDLQPAAPEVVLPIDQSQSVTCQSGIQPESGGDAVFICKGVKKYELLKQEIDRLNGLVETAEADLAKGESLPEEALGKLRAASGQARLLIRQKLQQFEGLCHKNIAQSAEEPFPTTCEDLAGFWDMVMLQVDHVDRLFEEITKLRNANWVEVKVPSKSIKDGTPKRKTGSGAKRSPASSTKTSASSEAARKAREEGRRKMMEERRRAMKEKQDTATTSGQVEIFVPQENDLKSCNGTL
ncbi:hypothetical protein L9F63_007465, partial [Diploptera punctata]